MHRSKTLTRFFISLDGVFLGWFSPWRHFSEKYYLGNQKQGKVFSSCDAIKKFFLEAEAEAEATRDFESNLFQKFGMWPQKESCEARGVTPFWNGWNICKIVGCCCSTAVEHPLCNLEVVGSNTAWCLAFFIFFYLFLLSFTSGGSIMLSLKEVHLSNCVL